MEREEGKVDYILEELEDNFSNDDLFNITSWGADPSVRELISQYEDGDIEKPELQRKYVWTKKAASRFIESLLLGLPVPSIFLANLEPSGKRLIIDGYQRICTLYDFIHEGIWGGDETVFRLVNSDIINERWRNKSYKELSADDQRRLRNYTIHAIIFEQKQPRSDTGLYQVFERINTSGTTLNAQEVRNCVYQGDLNTLLFRLNTNVKWRAMFGSEKEDSRMIDLELILRFFAMNRPEVYNSRERTISLTQLLNHYMSDYQKAESNLIEQKSADFKQVIDFLYDKFGEEAFFNLQKDLEKIRRRLYPTVYDSLMIGTYIALQRGIDESVVGTLKERRLMLLKDEEYRESITQGTMQVANIHRRIEKVLQILYNQSL